MRFFHPCGAVTNGRRGLGPRPSGFTLDRIVGGGRDYRGDCDDGDSEHLSTVASGFDAEGLE